MWFEVLPSIGVIFTAMTLGCYATGWVPLLVYGKPCYRQLITSGQITHYSRDERLTGSAYQLQGLEVIPDAEENKTSSCK